MKKTEKDFEYLETPPEVGAKGLRYITRPKSLDRMLNSPGGRQVKERISIYLDIEIIHHFKTLAENSEHGYQTLINNHLRQFVDKQQAAETVQEIKSELLHDPKFLHDLKEALAA